MNNSELDRLLKDWGEHNRPDADILARLETAIHGNIRRDKAVPVASAEAVGGVGSWPRWIAVAAGLVILLAGALVWKAHKTPDAAYAAAGNGAAELVRISAEQVAAGHTILDELDALFGGQLRWVRLEANELRLGMAGESMRAADSRTRLVVRTVIVAREVGRMEWEPVWSSDVLTRTEEYVHFATDSETPGDLKLWVDSLPDGRYVMDSEIAWPAARLVRPYESQVFTAGQPQPVLVQTLAGREYRIYQSIEPLESGRG